ncbi:MAG: hypothetical protein ACHRHE_00020 [Tepidisphaerales bacterium]
MKIAVFSESSADEAAVRILAEAVLGQPIEPVAGKALRRPRNGWTHVVKLLRAVILDLYFQTDADGLIVVVDSNDSPYHARNHDPAAESDCRWCQLMREANRACQALAARPCNKRFRVAIGLTPPAIETWLLFRRSPHYTEAAWIRGQGEGRPALNRRQLKQELYGTISPPLALETEKMVESARRLAGEVEAFERAFPIGFGAMADELRRWR